MTGVCAGIVLYNPEIKGLLENIRAVVNQVDRVYLFDNGSDNLEAIRVDCENAFPGRLYYIASETNLGIAAALNVLVKRAKKDGFVWMITLDQDSCCTLGMVAELYRYSSMKRVAMIGPKIVDKNIPSQQMIDEKMWEEVDECITSGCLTKLCAVCKAGYFAEELFIDEVDTEMCYRLRLQGDRIIRVNGAVLHHELGRATPVRLLTAAGKLLCNEYLRRPKFTTNHSNFRKYYIVRNNLYLLRKYKRLLPMKEKRKKFVKMVLLWYLGEGDWFGKTGAVLRGVRDSFRMDKQGHEEGRGA